MRLRFVISPYNDVNCNKHIIKSIQMSPCANSYLVCLVDMTVACEACEVETSVDVALVTSSRFFVLKTRWTLAMTFVFGILNGSLFN